MGPTWSNPEQLVQFPAKSVAQVRANYRPPCRRCTDLVPEGWWAIPTSSFRFCNPSIAAPRGSFRGSRHTHAPKQAHTALTAGSAIIGTAATNTWFVLLLLGVLSTTLRAGSTNSGAVSTKAPRDRPNLGRSDDLAWEIRLRIRKMAEAPYLVGQEPSVCLRGHPWGSSVGGQPRRFNIGPAIGKWGPRLCRTRPRPIKLSPRVMTWLALGEVDHGREHQVVQIREIWFAGGVSGLPMYTS